MEDQKQDKSEDRRSDDKPMSAHDQVMLAHAGTVIGHVNSVVHAVHQGADPAVIAVHIEHARDAAVDLAQHEDNRPKPAPAPAPTPVPAVKPAPVLALPVMSKPVVQAAPAKSWVRENLGTVVMVVFGLALIAVVAYQQYGHLFR